MTSINSFINTPLYLLFLYLLGRECAFLTRSQMMLMQLVQDPHTKNHCSNICYLFLPLEYQASSILDHDIYVAGSVNVSQHCILTNLESCNIAFQALITKWGENTRDKTSHTNKLEVSWGQGQHFSYTPRIWRTESYPSRCSINICWTDTTIIYPVTQARSHTGFIPFLTHNPTVTKSYLLLLKCLILGLSSPFALLLHSFWVLTSHMNYCNNFLIGPCTYILLFYFIIHMATRLISLKK